MICLRIYIKKSVFKSLLSCVVKKILTKLTHLTTPLIFHNAKNQGVVS